jgi:histidinol-phosphate aminotransferase
VLFMMTSTSMHSKEHVSMPKGLTRRSLLKGAGVAVASEILSRTLPAARLSAQPAAPDEAVYLNLNENAYGASSQVYLAIEREFSRVSRYADTKAANGLTEQIAAYERIPAEQVILGEILGALGLYFGSQGGLGGEFLYSTPGYLALVDTAARAGGIGVPVPLNARYQNDLAAFSTRITARTRLLYLINPHNPTGTVSDDQEFKDFLRESSQRAPIIVDEAYLEYTPDFQTRSAASLVRDGANVLVFRTFDKIHGLAGLPIGYALAPRPLADALRKQGIGDPESLGRLNIAAASAALADGSHVRRIRDTVAAERLKWNAVLDALRVRHTDARASFVFFDTGRPQPQFAEALRKRGVVIGRQFPPYTTWARITIGRPTENAAAQARVRELLRDAAG